MANKIKLFAESLKTIVKNAASGKDITVEDSVYNERMKACNTCDKHIKSTNQCGECGCFLAVKGRLADMKCPLNKWEK